MSGLGRSWRFGSANLFESAQAPPPPKGWQAPSRTRRYEAGRCSARSTTRRSPEGDCRVGTGVPWSNERRAALVPSQTSVRLRRVTCRSDTRRSDHAWHPKEPRVVERDRSRHSTSPSWARRPRSDPSVSRRICSGRSVGTHSLDPLSGSEKPDFESTSSAEADDAPRSSIQRPGRSRCARPTDRRTARAPYVTLHLLAR